MMMGRKVLQLGGGEKRELKTNLFEQLGVIINHELGLIPRVM